MQISRTFRHLVLAATIAVGIGATLTGTAEARNQNAAWNHPIYNDQQGWTQVDRNLDGRISSQEWNWAQKHGYDRLNGVAKRHLTRNEYQRFLDAYLDRRAAQYRQGWQRNGSQWGNQWGKQWAHDTDERRYERDPSPWYPSHQANRR